MNQYYYADESGNSVGPVSSDELMRLHKDGVIKSTTLITEANQETWIPLYKFGFTSGPSADTSALKECPLCGESIGSGIFGSNSLISPSVAALIKEYCPEQSVRRCEKCASGILGNAKERFTAERNGLVRIIQTELQAIPILSLQAPLHWDYRVCGLVTGQSVIGTGPLSEFSSAITDLFGSQSNAYRRKIKEGENHCATMLRNEAFEIGGNAVLAADVDYAELGGSKGMLMVCMTGTAVLLGNAEILGENTVQSLTRLGECKARLDYISSLVVEP
jgi:uncharacterized protein YbjQ (UPF0145 family)